MRKKLLIIYAVLVTLLVFGVLATLLFPRKYWIGYIKGLENETAEFLIKNKAETVINNVFDWYQNVEPVGNVDCDYGAWGLVTEVRQEFLRENLLKKGFKDDSIFYFGVSYASFSWRGEKTQWDYWTNSAPTSLNEAMVKFYEHFMRASREYFSQPENLIAFYMSNKKLIMERINLLPEGQKNDLRRCLGEVANFDPEEKIDPDSEYQSSMYRYIDKFLSRRYGEGKDVTTKKEIIMAYKFCAESLLSSVDSPGSPE